MVHFEKATLDPVTGSSSKLDEGDRARQEIFSVPSKLGSEDGTTSSDKKQINVAWLQDAKQSDVL